MTEGEGGVYSAKFERARRRAPKWMIACREGGRVSRVLGGAGKQRKRT